MKWVILDLDTRSNFAMIDTHTFSTTPTQEPISVVLSGGNKITSTHRCALDTLILPEKAQLGYIIPVLAAHLLVSVVALCNARCKVMLTKTDIKVEYRSKFVLIGSRYIKTRLWMMQYSGS